MDSYGMDYCGYCWAVAKDGEIQHPGNCKIGNLQALAARRLVLLKDIAEWYQATVGDERRFLEIDLVERLEKELGE